MSDADQVAVSPGGGRRWLGPFRRLSLPGCAAWALFFFLLLLVIVAWTVFFLNPIHVPWRHAMSWTRMATVLGLTVLTPLTLYAALRYALIRYRTRFPDIDRAWEAGIKALRSNGLSLQGTPVFVILGSPSAELEQSLLDTLGRELLVRGVPDGPAPLHWYAREGAIYLVCSEIGWVSRLNRRVQQQATHESAATDSLTDEGPTPAG